MKLQYALQQIYQRFNDYVLAFLVFLFSFVALLKNEGKMILCIYLYTIKPIISIFYFGRFILHLQVYYLTTIPNILSICSRCCRSPRNVSKLNLFFDNFTQPSLFTMMNNIGIILLKLDWRNCLLEMRFYLYYQSILEKMTNKLIVWLALIYITYAYCSDSCATCASPYSYYVSNTCYSCYDNYFLYNYRCYSCTYCSSYYQCDNCPSNSSTSTSTSSVSVATIVIIIISIIAGIIFLIIVGKCIRNICCNTEPYVVNYVPEGGVSAVNLIQQPSLSRVQVKYNWTHDGTKFLSSQNCAICLDSNVFLHTHCHHYFHPKCIWEWSTKKQGDCPLCKSKALFPARIYCQNCFEEYYEVDNQTLVVVIRQGKWRVCDHCKQI